MRPGFLSDFEAARFGRIAPSRFGRIAPSYAALGGFGKGYMGPPGPGSVVTPGKAVYRDGNWICPGAKPKATKDQFYFCCPSGWKKANYGDQYPCKGADGDLRDEDLLSCGPMPEDGSDVICCPSLGRWVNRPPSGENPCPSARQATAVTLTPGEILADPLAIDLREQPLVTPGLMIAIGGAMALGLGLFVMMSRKPKAA